VSVRAVLWDADGVLQYTPAESWDLAVEVVAQSPGAITGAPIDEERIRAVAHDLGLGDHVDDIVAVWSTFDLLSASLDGAYYSCDLGAAKPSAAFFEHIVTDLGLAPDQLLFLHDQPENVAGARSTGLDAVRCAHHDGIPRLRHILDAHGIPLDEGGKPPRR